MRLSRNDIITWRLLDDHMAYEGTVEHESRNSLVIISECPLQGDIMDSFAVINTANGTICARVDSVSFKSITFTKLMGDKRSHIRVDDMLPVSIQFVSHPGPYLSSITPLDRRGIRFPEFPVHDLPQEPLTRALSVINRKLDFLLAHTVLQQDGISLEIPRKVNISASGIRMDLHYHCASQDILELKIALPLSSPVLATIYGTPVRIREKTDNGPQMSFETAIDFLEMGDDVRDMVIQYTLQRQREIIHYLREAD